MQNPAPRPLEPRKSGWPAAEVRPCGTPARTREDRRPRLRSAPSSLRERQLHPHCGQGSGGSVSVVVDTGSVIVGSVTVVVVSGGSVIVGSGSVSVLVLLLGVVVVAGR